MSGRQPDWMDAAACAAHPHPEWWFPVRGGDVAHAKAICADCPVRIDCLDYAITEVLKHGIWGGTSERERRNIRRARNVVVGVRGPDIHPRIRARRVAS